MQLQDVMTHTVQTVPATATVQEAARLMEEHNIGFLPVVQDNVSSGVVTDRDLALRVVAQGRDSATTTVAEVMSLGPKLNSSVDLSHLPGVATLPAETEVEDALKFMEEKQVRRVMVHDHSYRIVGVVSRSDLPGTEAVHRK